MKKIKHYSILAVCIFLIIVCTNWVVWYTMMGGKKIPKKLSECLLEIAQIPSKTHGLFANRFQIDGRYVADTSIFTGFQYFVDKNSLPKGNILISTLNEKKDIEIKLININSRALIKKWVIEDDFILNLNKNKDVNKSNLRLFHPLLLKDSSIVVHANSYLFCFDSSNKLKWINYDIFHHSIESNIDSTIWTCSRIENKKSLSINEIDTLSNDAIIQVNANTGHTQFKKSVAEILVENGYMYLFAIGNFETDAIHLNQVSPAIFTSKYWNKGDLLISIRNRSTVFLYRPSSNKIIWLKTGPWSSQHCSVFVDSTKIMVFGNDVIRRGEYETLINGINQIYIYDFSKNIVSTPYSEVMSKLQIKTITEGRGTYLNDGKIFIDESNYGNIYIIDSIRPLLKYSEKADKSHTKLFNWSRFILN